MDIFVLNAGFQRNIVVDDVHSFIWTERYRGYGDFQMTVSPTPQNIEYLRHDQYLGHSESMYAMFIEEIVHERNDSGERVMKLKGRSLESFFENRISNSDQTLDAEGRRNHEGSPGEIVRLMVQREVINYTDDKRYEILTNLTSHNLVNSSRNIRITTMPGPVYKDIQELLSLDDLGFRLIPQNPPDLRFEVYKGVLRDGVTFSESLDNLKGSTYLASVENYKNVAHVWDRDHRTMRRVVDRGNTITVSGMERREVYIHASEVDSKGLVWEEVTPMLREVALRELRKLEKADLFDGEVVGDQFVYGIDYGLGDIVNVFDEFVDNRKARVTEFIWSYDDSGLSTYPTLSTMPE